MLFRRLFYLITFQIFLGFFSCPIVIIMLYWNKYFYHIYLHFWIKIFGKFFSLVQCNPIFIEIFNLMWFYLITNNLNLFHIIIYLIYRIRNLISNQSYLHLLIQLYLNFHHLLFMSFRTFYILIHIKNTKYYI